MRAFIDLMGQKFGRLTVLERAGKDANEHSGHIMWRCQCSCPKATIKSISGSSLRSGYTQSCGCLHKEVMHDSKFGKTHGHSGKCPSGTYQSWRSAISRCNNPNVHNFDAYGGRGITVCERWQGERGFENFLTDLGPRPEGKTLDRKEVNGNYEPGNCRWASQSIQSHNQRKQKNTTSQFRGVARSYKSKYEARICANGKKVFLGTFSSEIEAAKAYNDSARAYFGESAKLNSIPEQMAA